MKKYVKPIVEVVKVETHQMIAESLTIDSSKSGSQQFSRRGSSWDDDEE